ncbi:hypothetical protein [Stenomitos frigidus]|nr:hypothetical protein [Stenomitos frigidus]
MLGFGGIRLTIDSLLLSTFSRDGAIEGSSQQLPGATASAR